MKGAELLRAGFILAVSVNLTGCMAMHGLLGGGCEGMLGAHGGHDGPSGEHEGHSTPAPIVRAVCPVCVKSITVTESVPRTTHLGKTYYCDTEEHLKLFINDPGRFVKTIEGGNEGGEHRH